MDEKDFDNKVAELVSITSRLTVPHILMVRRMAMVDPKTLKWATEQQLTAIFRVILTKALERTPSDEVREANGKHFDPFLPPGSDDARESERWLLFELARPLLLAPSPDAADSGDDAETVDEDLTEFSVDFNDFDSFFDDTLCMYVRRTLSVLAAKNSRPYTQFPFVLAPAFGESYERILRACVLPAMRANKRIKDIGTSRNWKKEGPARLLGIVQAGGRDNPILFHWDSRWDVFAPNHVFKGKDGKPRPRRNNEDPWGRLLEDAESAGYVPPGPADATLLKHILRWDAETLNGAWTALSQSYDQEFQPRTRAERAREGSFRDSLVRCVERNGLHSGEALASKAFFEFPKCDRMFLRNTVQALGRSEADRKSKVPMLVEFLNSLPK